MFEFHINGFICYGGMVTIFFGAPFVCEIHPWMLEDRPVIQLAQGQGKERSGIIRVRLTNKEGKEELNTKL